jgi:subtilisin family serine protease
MLEDDHRSNEERDLPARGRAPRSHDMTKAELIKRDNEVRRRLHAFLLTEGFGRVNAVEGDGDEYRSAGTYRVPVLQSQAQPWAFSASDRVIVDAANLTSTQARLRRSRSVDNDTIEAKPIAGTQLHQVRTVGTALPSRLRNSLTSGAGGQPNHLFFAAYRYIVKEGEDYEDAPLPEAKRDGPGGDAKVAILDTGIWRGAAGDEFVGADVQGADPYDYDLLRADPAAQYLDFGAGHGTFVAGIVRQLAPGAQVDIIRVLGSSGVGLESDIAKGFDRAREAEADVVLCAFAGYSHRDEQPKAIEAALAKLSKRAVVVAAAGNERQGDRPCWPASFRDVEAIAALDSSRDGALVMRRGAANPAWYTNTGPDVTYAAAGTWSSSFVDGEEDPRFETDPEPDRFSGSARGAGTSFAAAAVAGAVAAAKTAGESGQDAWDRVRAETVPVKGDAFRGLDVWRLAE